MEVLIMFQAMVSLQDEVDLQLCEISYLMII